LEIESAGCLGITWVAGEFYRYCLFSENQFSGMGLAQQVVLAVMLNNDPALIAEQRFAVNATFSGSRFWLCAVLFERCRAVIDA
jgi:hypothetical protein